MCAMATSEHSVRLPLRASAEDPARFRADDAAGRILRLVAMFRLTVATTLVTVSLVWLYPLVPASRESALFLPVAVLYLAVAAVWLSWQWRPSGLATFTAPMYTWLELAVDIAAITLLMHAGGGIRSGLGGLLVIFVGAASLRLGGQQALLAAAVAALAVLGEQGMSYLKGYTGAPEFVPAGLLGAIIFIVAAAAYPLARRLEESEALARQRGIDLANLAQLNDYVIQNLRESIVVVDEQNRIRLINQPAAEHLGIRTREPGQDLERLAPVVSRILADWRKQGNPLLQPPAFTSADGTTRINAYIAPVGSDEAGPVLMFLEDAGLLAAKIQQTKLAALGRLSASIAHEIRNPIGALSHAGQLLAESPAIGAEDRRLTDIINTNCQRVSEIVDNVLQLSRRENSRPELIYLAGWTREFAAEFSSTLELFEGQIAVAAGEDVEVRMDPGHLRQVAWNLCENAAKYASEAAGGIAIELRHGRLAGSRRPYFEVADRGPGIAEEMREQIFEPFATGRTGNTGLGLFISRELCECNGAALIYEVRDGGGSVFRIVFADPARWAA